MVEDILQYPFILTEKHMGCRRSFDEEQARHSLDIVPIPEIGRTDLITDLLEWRVAVSYLPDFVTALKVKEGRPVHLEVSDFKTDIRKQLIYHKNKSATGANRAEECFLKQKTQNIFCKI